MRRGLWLFLTLAAGPSGNPRIAAGFALAVDAHRSKAAPAIGGNPSSAESIDAGIRLPGDAASLVKGPGHTAVSSR
jgi:hypothetical protein